MNIEEINNTACQIIAFAGNGKSFSMEAIAFAEEKQLDAAEDSLKEAEQSITKAHEIHTKLLVEDARNPGSIQATMMLIHASNHLSIAEFSLDMAKKFVNVYKKH